jgi:hypothetical protein
MYGACKSEDVEKNVGRLEALQFERVDFDQADAKETERSTNNTKTFKHVPSLSVEEGLK